MFTLTWTIVDKFEQSQTSCPKKLPPPRVANLVNIYLRQLSVCDGCPQLFPPRHTHTRVCPNIQTLKRLKAEKF